MAIRIGLLGKKIGMTQVYADDGERIPVTVLQTGPCYVVGKRTMERDGYSALILGFDDKPARLVNKPLTGFFKAGDVSPKRFVQELRIDAADAEKFEVGSVIKAQDIFEEGVPLDVTSRSIGKGFQGVIKRHNMRGTKATHGFHEFYRHGGSIGCRLTPGRVAKGKKMAGQMGDASTKIQNLQLLSINEDENYILVRGSVAGAKGCYVTITKAVTRDVYKRVGMGQEEARSKNPLKASKQAAAGRA